MHFTHHVKVNDDMKFYYYKKKFIIMKNTIVKTIGLCNSTSFVIKWVKQHGFNNSQVTNHICPF